MKKLLDYLENNPDAIVPIVGAVAIVCLIIAGIMFALFWPTGFRKSTRKKTDEEREIIRNAKDKTISEEERKRREKVLKEIFNDPYFRDTPVDDPGVKYQRK